MVRMFARRYGMYALAALVLGLVAFLAFASGSAEQEAPLSDAELAVLAANERTARPSGAAGALQGEAAEVRTGLSVISYPTEAMVSVEFEPVGEAPFDAMPLDAGSYFVSVSKPGYVQLDTLVFVDRGRISKIYVMLEPEDGLTGAAGGGIAQVEDVVESRLEPTRPPESSPSDRQRAVQPPPAEVQRPEPTRAAPPEPAARVGGLRVATEPAGATVLLEGRVVGETPLVLGDLRPDRYALVLRKDGHTPYSERVTVNAGDEASLRVTLAPSGGEVTVLVRPWGSIYVNGELRRSDTDVQYSAKLPAGTHTIRVTHPGLGSKEQTVEVTPGGSKHLVIDLN